VHSQVILYTLKFIGDGEGKNVFMEKFIKPFVKLVLYLFGLKRESIIAEFGGNSDIENISRGCILREKLCDQNMEEWTRNELDCMILPATAIPALKHDQSVELNGCSYYTASLNAFDYPAGIIPNVIKITSEHLEEVYDDPDFPNDN
jgi:hypothetical protein